MALPDALKHSVETTLSWSITSVQPLSGGDINSAALIQTGDGPFFIKWNERAPDDLFEKEAKGLGLLRSATDSLDIPDVVHWSPPEGSVPSYLIIDYLQSGPENRQIIAKFGESLANIHASENSTFGLDHDNYIGRLPQNNTPDDTWSRFFIANRIEPQIRMAFDSGRLGSGSLKNWEALAKRLDSFFPDSRPSLLHGDLWSGNWFCSITGRIALIDPAVYFGHPEMELAYTQLFGRFPDPFYSAYESVYRLPPGFQERIPVYNLYPLLVHTNLFGGHYANSVDAVLQRYA